MTDDRDGIAPEDAPGDGAARPQAGEGSDADDGEIRLAPAEPPPGPDAPGIDPDMPSPATAMVPCSACGTMTVAAGAVRVGRRPFCSPDCALTHKASYDRVDPSTGAGYPIMRWVFAVACLLGLMSLVGWIASLPSSTLLEARKQRERVRVLTNKGRHADALAAAERLAKLEPDGREATRLVNWGKAEKKRLARMVGMQRVALLEKSITGSDLTIPGAVERLTVSILRMRTRFAHVPDVVEAADRLRAELQKRRPPVRKPVRKILTPMMQTTRFLSELSGRVDVHLAAQEVGEARELIVEAEARAGTNYSSALNVGIAKVRAQVDKAVADHWREQLKAIRGLVAARRFDEARALCRATVAGCGEQFSAAAATELAVIDKAEGVSTVRETRQRTKRERSLTADAGELLAEFRYADAIASLERVAKKLPEGKLKDSIGTTIAAARLERELMKQIIDKINRNEVKAYHLEAARPGVLTEADTEGFKHRMALRSTSGPAIETKWQRLPPGQLARLARLAAGKDEKLLVAAALLCMRHGAEAQAKEAIADIHAGGMVRGVLLMEKFAALLPAAGAAAE